MLKTQNNFYFVYEYCNGGTLENMLRKLGTIEEGNALLILKQLLEAFQVLNKYNIMHRDLKPDNIFFHNGVVKVGDFGFCKSLEKAEMTKTMLGSPIYMAPEILNGQIYSNKADIWSIGVVLYEMLYGECPFESSSIPKLIEVLKDTELEFSSDVQVTSETRRLLKRILTKDPQRRIVWMELFQININSEGRFDEPAIRKINLVDEDKRLVREAREIESDEVSSNSTAGSSHTPHSPSSHNYKFNSQATPGFHSYTSPRSANEFANGKSSQSNEERAKGGLTKKPHGMVEEGETVSLSSPLRKPKGAGTGTDLSAQEKEKVLKFHQ
jgi:serine/threonine protein kinase